MAYEVSVKEIQPLRFAGVRAKTTINKVTEKVTQLLNETADYLEAQASNRRAQGSGSATKWALLWSTSRSATP